MLILSIVSVNTGVGQFGSVAELQGFLQIGAGPLMDTAISIAGEEQRVELARKILTFRYNDNRLFAICHVKYQYVT